jgi:prepilin-type N-terminal cleavage/methylation domain-containing protein
MQSSCSGGLTLIECLLTLALVSIISFTSIPIWTSLIHKNQINLTLHSLMHAIEFTQMAALTYHMDAVLCGSADHLHCDKSWHQGQITRLANGKVLRRYPPTPGHEIIVFRSSFHQNHYLRFQSNGSTDAQRGSFYLCKTAIQNDCHTRLVILNTGRMRVES